MGSRTAFSASAIGALSNVNSFYNRKESSSEEEHHRDGSYVSMLMGDDDNNKGEEDVFEEEEEEKEKEKGEAVAGVGTGVVAAAERSEGEGGDDNEESKLMGGGGGVLVNAAIQSLPFSRWRRSTQQKFCLICLFVMVLYISSNCALNFGNGYIFTSTGFRFPLLMTSVHALMGTLLGLLYIRAGKSNPKCIKLIVIDFKKQGLQVLLMGAFFASNIGFSNASYMTISVMLNQVIRSLNTVFTAIFFAIAQKKLHDLWYWMGIIGITGSVIMSLYGNPVFQWVGFVFALISSVCAALMTTLTGCLTQSTDQKLDSVNIAVWTGVPIFAFCMPFFLWFEFMQILSYTQSSPLTCVGILLSTGLVAFLNNVLYYELIYFTGPVYSTVVGNIKTVFIFVIAAAWNPSGERELSALNWSGIGLTVVAFFYMTYISYKESMANTTTTIAPTNPPSSSSSPLTTRR